MAKDVEKILVIKLGALGDYIQALGPMAAIRNHHPGARITLLTTAPYEEFSWASGYFDDVWIDKKPSWTQIPGWLKLKKRLNEEGFARVYDLQNNDRTAFYFKLFSTQNTPEWVGVAKGASHRNASPIRTKGHAFDGHVQTLALAGITDVVVDRLEWMQASISSYPLRKPYALLVPGSAPERLEKRWPAENYGRFARILSQWGYQPVIIGGKAENAAALEILKEAPDALDLTGQTNLQQIAVLARGAAGAIGNDTGPMHLVAATGCPCLALFSQSSHATRHAPKGDYVEILQEKNLEDLKPEKVLGLFKPREQPPHKSAILH